MANLSYTHYARIFHIKHLKHLNILKFWLQHYVNSQGVCNGIPHVMMYLEIINSTDRFTKRVYSTTCYTAYLAHSTTCYTAYLAQYSMFIQLYAIFLVRNTL